MFDKTSFCQLRVSKSRVIKCLKALFFISILIYLILNLPDLLIHIKAVSLSTMAGLIVLQLLAMLVIAYQWKLCDKVLDIKPSPEHCPKRNGKLRVMDFWILNSYGKLLEGITPGAKTGGEGLKAVMLVNKFKHTKKDAVILVLIQKSVSLVSFLSILIALCVIFSVQGSHTLINLSNVVKILAIIALAIISLGLILKYISQKNSKYKELLKLDELISTLRKRKFFVFLAFLLGLFNWTLLCSSAFLISLDMELGLSGLQVANATFMGYLFSMIPISPGGIGTYEGAMTLQLSNFNVTYSSALGLSILSRVFTFWIAILISFFTITLIKVKKKGKMINFGSLTALLFS
ncbi:lysylphosphatidylglycerol synthase transmembrane domain-containing protein [Proteinivorax hydrogeniformans]|uniref:Phosphatidylglycerol lysyltransferase n=1 Tax=Proteinivorax hydrogeniformans TaxID=1826727 RepID=A0AAU8HVC9_9FIRM